MMTESVRIDEPTREQTPRSMVGASSEIHVSCIMPAFESPV